MQTIEQLVLVFLAALEATINQTVMEEAAKAFPLPKRGRGRPPKDSLFPVSQQGEEKVLEGFRRMGSVANAPWFALKKGNVLHGVLENVYERRDERSKTGTSRFFQLRLIAPCEVRTGLTADFKILRAAVGSVVNLNYGPKSKLLEGLIPSILEGAEYETWIYVGDKLEIGGGRTMWNIEIYSKLIKSVPANQDGNSQMESAG
jgi:hypothetical protein